MKPSKLKGLWNDPVMSSVIAGAILGIGALVGSYFLNWWPSIGHFASDAYDFVFSLTTLPNWLIGVLALFAIATIAVLCVLIWQKISHSTSNVIDWRNYKTDNFLGLRWRWSYFKDGGIYEMHTFCPNCDFQVYAEDASAYRAVDRISFHCDSCGQRLGEFNESYASLESKVKRLVQQKIRNGSWLPDTNT
jgi:hypothetical protein